MNFPNSPSENDTYTLGSKTWQYDGNAWFLTAKTITTANIPESGNLYYTDVRAFANLSSATTTSLTEGDNLYFTNTRAVYALTGGEQVSIDSNGLITSTVTQSESGFNPFLLAGM